MRTEKGSCTGPEFDGPTPDSRGPASVQNLTKAYLTEGPNRGLRVLPGCRPTRGSGAVR